MLFGVASGVAAYMFSRRRPQAAAATPPAVDELVPDQADPVQSMDALDQLDLVDLDVDALSLAEGTGEFERAAVEPSLEDGQSWTEALETSAAENGPLPDESLESLVDGGQDLYGARYPSGGTAGI